ncbi:MAG: Nramp family divalent metal transporter [Pirellula sp.]
MNQETEAYDPYALPKSAIVEPPTTLWESLKQIGPGIILAGTIVGSGELILTTAIGAKYGFVFLWLILFSCVIKVFVQIELGRYAISSGQPTLGALKRISTIGSIGSALLVWWGVMTFFTVFQLGGMMGGVSQSLKMAMPGATDRLAQNVGSVSSGFGEYLQARPELIWAVLICIITIAILYGGGYRRIEGLTTVLVVGLTLVTVVATVSLFFTLYAPAWDAIVDGLKLKIPSEGIADAFAVFGITGVGATELFYYPYWCLEKGYARYTGVNDGTPEWQRRAQGWIRIMKLDAWISMVVFTLSTVAFYAMGAAVLHPQGLVPQGSKMIVTLAEMYKAPFGAWTEVFFLIAAGVVLFKTLYLACAANSRMTVDFMALFDWISVRTAEHRARLVRRLCIAFPVFALTLYIVKQDPQLMVRMGGLAQAATLPMIASATLYFRYRKVDTKLQPGWLTDVCLWVAWLAIMVVAAYSIPDSFSKMLAALKVGS